MLSHELNAASTKTYVVFGQAVKICAPTQNKANQNEKLLNPYATIINDSRGP
jgi:hypothetical protein